MSYSCNDNQNYFVSEGRTTSRVMAPPGGVSHWSLGNDQPPKPKETSAKKVEVVVQELPKSTTATAATTGSPAGITKTEEPPPRQTNNNNMNSNRPLLPGESAPNDQPVSSNAFASGANMNGANVMTGRPTSRVLAPPGGHSALGGSLW